MARVLAGRARPSFDTDRLAVFALAAAVVVPLLVFVAVPVVAILRRGSLVFEERGDQYSYDSLKDIYHRHAN